MKLQIPLFLLAAAVIAAPAFSASSADLQERVERLERRVGHLSELTLEVEAIKRQNRILLGRIEEQQHQLERMRQKQRELYLDLDQRISGAVPAPRQQPQTAVSVPEVSEAPVVPTTPQAAAVTDTVAAQAAYDKAYNLLRPEQRRYKEAISAFDQFLKTYPGSELADNAQYWLAEANYVTQNNEAALANFKKLVAQYPESQKVPGALLKIGYILDASGQQAEAKKYLKMVISDHPSSSAAGMAKQRMSSMR